MRLAAVVAALAICVPRTSGAVEYAFEANKLIGRAKVLERDENYERAIEVIEQAREILEQWKDSMMEDEEEGAEGGEGGEGGKAGGPGTAAEDSPVEFVWETTSQPERACRERAEAGDVLRLHYITKLHSTKQVVDSSFHTGSTPLKITLGRPELPGAWNRALEGMCVGERRSIVAPPELAYGEVGYRTLPARRNLEFFIELVDMTKKRRRRDADEL